MPSAPGSLVWLISSRLRYRFSVPAAAVLGTRDGKVKPSLFSTSKYSLRLVFPTIGSRRFRSASTEAASQMQTARVPSGVGKVWWRFALGERVLGSASFQNEAGSETVCWTRTYIVPPERHVGYRCW